MAEHGRPNKLEVQYRATGADTAETVIVLTYVPELHGGIGNARKETSIEVKPGELVTGDIYHAYPVDTCRHLC